MILVTALLYKLHDTYIHIEYLIYRDIQEIINLTKKQISIMTIQNSKIVSFIGTL